MKIKTVLIDDNKKDSDIIIEKLKTLSPLVFDVSYFSSALDNLIYETDADLYILDIDMPELDGIECASRITKKLPHATFIFYSNYDHLITNALLFNTIFFIRKSYLNYDFEIFSKKIISHFQNEKGTYIYRYNKTIREIAYKNIIYFEAMHNNVYIHLLDGETLTQRIAIKNTIHNLPSFFISCHKSFCININYVKIYNTDNLVMSNGSTIPISKSNKQIFRSTYIKMKIKGY